MQTKPMKELKAKYPKAKVVQEKDFIDVSILIGSKMYRTEVD